VGSSAGLVGCTILGGVEIMPRESSATSRVTGTVEQPDNPATGKALEMYQVGRKTQAGLPVAREARALDDIEKATKQRPKFVPYN